MKAKKVSPRIQKAADDYIGHPAEIEEDVDVWAKREAFKEGATWLQSNAWIDAQGDDLPEYDREVIVLLDRWNGVELGENMRVGFAHRPNPKGWNGKSLTTGKYEHFDVQTYGKGGWNGDGVKYWLDIELPKTTED